MENVHLMKKIEWLETLNRDLQTQIQQKDFQRIKIAPTTDLQWDTFEIVQILGSCKYGDRSSNNSCNMQIQEEQKEPIHLGHPTTPPHLNMQNLNDNSYTSNCSKIFIHSGNASPKKKSGSSDSNDLPMLSFPKSLSENTRQINSCRISPEGMLPEKKVSVT